MGYFGVLTYAALAKIRTDDDNRKFATGATLVTVGMGCTLMLFNGQASQRMEPTLFMSLYALFNLYTWFIAYMYAPSLDFTSNKSGAGQPNTNEAEKERQKIMNEFYLSEMPKDSKEDNDDEDDTAGLTSGVSSTIGIKKQKKLEEKVKNHISNPYKSSSATGT